MNTAVYLRHIVARLPVLWAIVAVVLFDHGAWALPVPIMASSSYVEAIYRTEDGLPQNSIKSILQTRDGYLWLATQEGLARYDGRHFTSFTPFDHPGLISNNIHNILEDGNGSLWIHANSGLCRFDHGIFKDMSPSDRVHGLRRGRDGSVYVLTDTSVYRCGPAGLVGVVRFSDFTGVEGWPEPSLTVDNAGNVWWMQLGRLFKSDARGTTEIKSPRLSGISTIALAGDTLLTGGDTIDAVIDGVTTTVLDKKQCGGHVVSLTVDEAGRVWVQTDLIVSVFASGTAPAVLGKVIGRFPIGANRYRPIVDTGGRLWWVRNGAGGNELLRFHNGVFEKRQTQTSLPLDSGGTPVLTDREGIDWIGEVDGLECFRPIAGRTFRCGGDMPAGGIQSVLVDHRGDVWAGTKLHGLGRLAQSHFVPFPDARLQTGSVDAMCDDGGDGLWIMASGRLYHQSAGVLHDVTSRVWGAAPPGWVTALYVDDRRRLWIAADDLLCLDGVHTTKAPLNRDTQTGGRVFAMCADGVGGLWVSGSQGVGRLDGDRVRWFGPSAGLPSVPVIDFHRESDGTVWMATWGAGLVRYSRGKFTSIKVADGLLADSVHRIVEDDRGVFWIGSSKGVFTVRRSELEGYADGRTRVISCLPMVAANGADGGICAAATYPAGCRDGHGGVWFAAVRGLMHLRPEATASGAQPVVVEDATLNGRAVSTDRSVRVPPGPGTANFRFACLSFLAPNETQYRYRLDGFDAGWIELSGDPTAHYTNLPPGRYRFEVEARTELDRSLIGRAGVDFVLLPYFYQTASFKLLLIVLIAVVPAALFGFRARNLRRLAVVLEQKVTERTVEIAAQNTMLMDMQAELEAQADALAEANTRLEGLATTDGLTGLKNRRAFQDYVDAAWNEARRFGDSLSLIMLDVDRFKQYNDTYGHQEGDAVLRSVGRILTEQARDTDFVARYGGEEFVIVLPRSGVEASVTVAERYRKAVEMGEWPLRSVTGSFGIATMTSDMKSSADLIAAADTALYVSKHDGRNRVTHSTSVPVQTGESGSDDRKAA